MCDIALLLEAIQVDLTTRLQPFVQTMNTQNDLHQRLVAVLQKMPEFQALQQENVRLTGLLQALAPELAIPAQATHVTATHVTATHVTATHVTATHVPVTAPVTATHAVPITATHVLAPVTATHVPAHAPVPATHAPVPATHAPVPILAPAAPILDPSGNIVLNIVERPPVNLLKPFTVLKLYEDMHNHQTAQIKAERPDLVEEDVKEEEDDIVEDEEEDVVQEEEDDVVQEEEDDVVQEEEDDVVQEEDDDDVQEEDDVVQEEDDDDVQEEDALAAEEEVFIINIPGTGPCYTNNEQNGTIYQVLGEDDVGDCIGYFKNGAVYLN